MEGAQGFSGDVEMMGPGTENVADKQLWTTDWDDEEVDEDFSKQLREQLKMNKWTTILSLENFYIETTYILKIKLTHI